MLKVCAVALIVMGLPIVAGLNNKANVEREEAAAKARLTTIQPVRSIPVRLSSPTYGELEDRVYELENRLARYE